MTMSGARGDCPQQPTNVEQHPAAAHSQHFTVIEKVRKYQAVIRGLAEERLSSGNECWVFTKLVDLTIGWGRDSAWLQKADLVGVCSKSTVFRCLNAIEAAGLIVRKTRGCGIVYSVNIAEIDRAVAQDRKDAAMASLPKPKGNRGSTRVNLTSLRPSTRVNLTPPYKQYPSDTSYLQEESSIVPGTPVTSPEEGKIFPGEEEGPPTPQSPPELPVKVRATQRRLIGGSVAERVEQAKANSRARREAAKSKTKGGKASATAIEAIWRDALAIHHEMMAVSDWTVRERSIALKLAERFAPGKPDRFRVFLEWVVEHWTAIVSRQFAWMTKSPAPQLPSLNFLSRWLDRFAEVYHDRALEDWLAKPERTEIEKMVGRGMTHEQAFVHLAEGRAVGKLRGEIDVKVKKAARFYAQAEQARADAQRENLFGRRVAEARRVGNTLPPQAPKRVAIIPDERADQTNWEGLRLQPWPEEDE